MTTANILGRIPLILSDIEQNALQTLVDAGARLTTFGPRRAYKTGDAQEFHFTAWKSARASLSKIRKAIDGSAIVALTGYVFDVIDVDPRNGGFETMEELKVFLPPVWASVSTPGGGHHYYVPATGFPKVCFGGIDYLGLGGLVFLPGTKRPKYGYQGYVWEKAPRIDFSQRADSKFVEQLIELSGRNAQKLSVRMQPNITYVDSETGTFLNTQQILSWAHAYVATAQRSQRNNTLNNVAFQVGLLLPDTTINLAALEEALLSACHKNGLFQEDGQARCLATIQSGYLSAQHSKEAH